MPLNVTTIKFDRNRKPPFTITKPNDVSKSDKAFCILASKANTQHNKLIQQMIRLYEESGSTELFKRTIQLYTNSIIDIEESTNE